MGNFKTIYLAIIIALLSFNAAGQFTTQYIGTREPILNQFYTNVNDGASVHIYWALDGTNHPPNHYGEPDLYNMLLLQCEIGDGVDPNLHNSGKFSSIIDKSVGAKIFARVFNKGFYCDSPLYTIARNTTPIFINFNKSIDTPLDNRDFDGDGLNNSWEQTYLTDPYNEDSDNDGYSDYLEVCVKTDPNNSNDFLIVYGLEPLGEDMLFTWDVRGGVEYFVEQTTNYLTNTNLIWDVADTNVFGFYIITNKYNYSVFRIRVECE